MPAQNYTKLGQIPELMFIVHYMMNISSNSRIIGEHWTISDVYKRV